MCPGIPWMTWKSSTKGRPYLLLIVITLHRKTSIYIPNRLMDGDMCAENMEYIVDRLDAHEPW